MKKFLKLIGIIFSLIILIFITIIILLYSPIDKNNFSNNEITINEVMINSLNNISIINGGESLIRYNYIEGLINNKLSDIKDNESSITLEKLKVKGKNDGTLILVGYTNIELNDKIHIPTSFTLKSNIQIINDEILLKITGIKVGKISLPFIKIFDLINDRMSISSKIDYDYITQIDTDNMIFKINTSKLFSNFENIVKISDLQITNDGISIKLLPHEIISNILIDNFKPAINIIKEDINKIESTISNENEKKLISKVKNVISKIENEEINNITASNITELISDIDNLKVSSKEDFIEIFSRNINENSKEQLIKSFSNVLTNSDLEKMKNTFKNK